MNNSKIKIIEEKRDKITKLIEIWNNERLVLYHITPPNEVIYTLILNSI